ncbi:unnamed protein product [Sphagnum balticum]
MSINVGIEGERDQGQDVRSNNGATILKRLEVEHPAAKLLVQLAQLQDSEVGDGTTSVVILAAELLKRANELIKMKVHPTNIIQGYKIAAKEACRYIEEKLSLSGSLPLKCSGEARRGRPYQLCQNFDVEQTHRRRNEVLRETRG